jgi:hypothetical protein
MIAQGESIMDLVSNPISRRNIMAVAAAGGLFTSSMLAEAQTGESVPEPRRPGRGPSLLADRGDFLLGLLAGLVDLVANNNRLRLSWPGLHDATWASAFPDYIEV